MEKRMPSGYWVVFADVTDPEGYKAYIAENAKVFRKYGGHFLVRSGKSQTVEGTAATRTVVIEFKDYATAVACFRSPEYAKAIELRKGRAKLNLVIIDGYDGPHPLD